MLHDEATYPEPFKFNPERFMTADGQFNKNVNDPFHAIFGFGRRICPGRFMAASTIWIAVASVIAAFDFGRLDSTAGSDDMFHPGILRCVHVTVSPLNSASTILL